MTIKQARAELDDALYVVTSLVTTSEEVGLESISVDTFVSALSRAHEKSMKLFNLVSDDSKEVEVVIRKESEFKLSDAARKVNIIAQGKNMAFKPVGFEGKVIDFSTFLLSISDEMKDCGDGVRQANRALSVFVTHPDDLTKPQKISMPVFKKVKKRAQEFGEFFEGKEGLDRALFKALYRNYRDFDEVSESIETLTREFNGASVQGMRKDYHALLDTVIALINHAERTDRRLHKDVAVAIADALRNLADWLSLYALFLAKIISLAGSHKDTADHLNKLAG